MTSIRTLSFDLDDTLWDNKPVIAQAELTMMAWLDENAPQLTAQFSLEDLTHHKFQLLKVRPDLKAKISDLRRESICLALIKVGYTDLQAHNLAAEAFACFLHARHQVTYFEGVEDTLKQLSEHYQLIAISNGNINVQRLPVSSFFTHAFSAENLRVKKPDPMIYHIALQQSRIMPEETIHIGDCPVNDIYAAQQAGLRTIWFNPENLSWKTGKIPDATIQCINKLPGVLSLLST